MDCEAGRHVCVCPAHIASSSPEFRPCFPSILNILRSPCVLCKPSHSIIKHPTSSVDHSHHFHQSPPSPRNTTTSKTTHCCQQKPSTTQGTHQSSTMCTKWYDLYACGCRIYNSTYICPESYQNKCKGMGEQDKKLSSKCSKHLKK